MWKQEILFQVDCYKPRKSQLVYHVCRTRFEYVTSRVRNRGANYSAATLGLVVELKLKNIYETRQYL